MEFYRITTEKNEVNDFELYLVGAAVTRTLARPGKANVFLL